MLNLTTNWLRSIGLLPKPVTIAEAMEHRLFKSAAGTKNLMIHMLEATPHRRLS